MGILTGSFSGTIWRTAAIDAAGPRLSDLAKGWLAKIEKRRFVPIDKSFRPMIWQSAGWVDIDDLLESAFGDTDQFLFTDIAAGAIIALSVRVDEIKIQRKVLKAEAKKHFKEIGVSKPSKDEKAEIEERIMERMHRENPATVSIYETSWDVQTGIVAFTGRGRNAEVWRALFEETFGVELEATDPFSAARRIVGRAGEAALLDAQPAAFTPAYKDLEEEEEG